MEVGTRDLAIRGVEVLGGRGWCWGRGADNHHPSIDHTDFR